MPDKMLSESVIEVIEAKDVKVGYLVLGFVDVPQSFLHLNRSAIDFLKKYGFKKMEIFRDGRTIVAGSEDLKVDDRLLSMGNMTHYIRIKRPEQIERLVQMGFKRIKTMPYDEPSEQRKETSKSPEASFSLPKQATKENKRKGEISTSVHKLQDKIKDSQDLIKEGTAYVHDLFSQGHQQHFDIKHLEFLSNEINNIVNESKDAINVLSFLKSHDDYTYKHCIDVANQMLVALNFLNKIKPIFSKDQLKDIGIGALLHDIGKSKIPVELINKPGRLSDTEWVYMRMHPSYSAKIMTDIGLSKNNIQIGLYHHVHKNGGGYPKASFSSVPLAARMCSIADVFQALTTRRPYRKTDPPFLALKKIKMWSSDQFDEQLTDIFIKAFGLFPPGSLVTLNDKSVAFVMVNTANSLKPVIAVIFDENGQKIGKPPVIDLQDPEYSSLQIEKAADLNDFFEKDEAIDLFLSIDF